MARRRETAPASSPVLVRLRAVLLKSSPRVEWLTMAWTARGKRGDGIAAASKEFLKMLVALALAALFARGAKANRRT